MYINIVILKYGVLIVQSPELNIYPRLIKKKLILNLNIKNVLACTIDLINIYDYVKEIGTRK